MLIRLLLPKASIAAAHAEMGIYHVTINSVSDQSENEYVQDTSNRDNHPHSRVLYSTGSLHFCLSFPVLKFQEQIPKSCPRILLRLSRTTSRQLRDQWPLPQHGDTILRVYRFVGTLVDWTTSPSSTTHLYHFQLGSHLDALRSAVSLAFVSYGNSLPRSHCRFNIACLRLAACAPSNMDLVRSEPSPTFPLEWHNISFSSLSGLIQSLALLAVSFFVLNRTDAMI